MCFWGALTYRFPKLKARFLGAPTFMVSINIKRSQHIRIYHNGEYSILRAVGGGV